MSAEQTTITLRDRILAQPDARFEDVTIASWGLTVRVVQLSGAELPLWSRAHFDEAGQARPAEEKNMRVLIACVRDPETGAQILTDADVEALGKKGGPELNQLLLVALMLNTPRIHSKN